MITVKEAKARVDTIEASKDDDESAHSMEDALHVSVLSAIAQGSPNAQELAKIALLTKKIGFSRWCA